MMPYFKRPLLLPPSLFKKSNPGLNLATNNKRDYIVYPENTTIWHFENLHARSVKQYIRSIFHQTGHRHKNIRNKHPKGTSLN